MGQYQKYFLRIFLFLIILAFIIVFNYQDFENGFFQNTKLNSVIILVFLFGLMFSIRNIYIIKNEHQWIDLIFSKEITSIDYFPKIVKELKGDVKNLNNDKFNIQKANGHLDRAVVRLDNDREINKYLIALLVFLGLLGTFWGLLMTVESVGNLISNLSIEEEDILSTFLNLRTGLEAPLSGMGVAFSSSLFGLAGSLCLGFIDLQLGKTQNDFLIYFEKKIMANESKTTKIMEKEQGSLIYVEALLQQTAEGINKLESILEKNETSKKSLEDVITKAILIITKMNDEINLRITDYNKNEITNLEILRNIDNTLISMKDELKETKDETSSQLIKELNLLSKTISLIKK